MKKILLTLTFAAISCIAFGQFLTWQDTIDCSNIAGDDTIVFYSDSLNLDLRGGMWTVEVRYDSLDADDATFSIGGSVSGVGWNKIDSDDLPFTLDVTTNTDGVNGTNRTTATFYGFYWPYRTLGIKVDPGTATKYLIFKVEK